MGRQIYLNLPVKDLNKTIEFFTKLGFKFNQQFTDENATCMIIDEGIYVMLLVEKFFKSFMKKDIADTSKNVEAITCVSAESREEVDEMIRKAVVAGAKLYKEPEDHGWMYGHSFSDLDGHLWEFVYMDMSAMPKSP
jgi:predicted lactoylglutathione lyase